MDGARRGRAPSVTVSLVVPWRPDTGPRAHAWAWLRQRYARCFPDWEIVTGVSDDPDWCKAEAVNDAARRARGAVLVIADADVVCTTAALRHAVALASNQPWVIPHRIVYRLNPLETVRVLAGDPERNPAPDPTAHIRTPYTGVAGGGMLVLRHGAFHAVGGMDQRFRNWGRQDEALAVALDTLVGRPTRLDAPLWHLWHDPGARLQNPHYQRNTRLYRAYEGAFYDPPTMRTLIRRAGPRCPLCDAAAYACLDEPLAWVAPDRLTC